MTIRVEVLDSPGEVAGDVADRLLALAARRQADGGVPSIVLTGGSIADAVHAEVARRSAGSGPDWGAVDLWWGDERFVAADSPERNEGQARRALLDHVPVDPARVHPAPADTGQGLDAAAAAYDAALREQGPEAFDLVLLGMGPDGHVASLFPGYPQLEVTDRLAVAVPDAPKPPPARVSLTCPALARAREVWFVVTSAEKSAAVARALAGLALDRDGAARPTGARTDPHEIPAAGITAHDQVTWFLDTDAASDLPPR